MMKQIRKTAAKNMLKQLQKKSLILIKKAIKKYKIRTEIKKSEREEIEIY